MKSQNSPFLCLNCNFAVIFWFFSKSNFVGLEIFLILPLGIKTELWVIGTQIKKLKSDQPLRSNSIDWMQARDPQTRIHEQIKEILEQT